MSALSGPPAAGTSVPAALAFLKSPRLVWQNELDGLTATGRFNGEVVFAKWAPLGSGIQLSDERERLRWTAPFTPVPTVVDYWADGAGEVLITRAIDARNAVDGKWLAEPSAAISAVARGLRRFHDALPVEDCPFGSPLESWVESARSRGRTGFELLARDEPPIDRLVVCHGDPCMPNTLLSDGGDVVAHVDLGSLGVADRWADIAVAARNASQNYGGDRVSEFLDAYGIDPDPARQKWYLALWDLT